MGRAGKLFLLAVGASIVGMSAFLLWQVGLRWYHGLPGSPRHLERVLGGRVHATALPVTCTRCPGYAGRPCGTASLNPLRLEGDAPEGPRPDPFREDWTLSPWRRGAPARLDPDLAARVLACLRYVAERCQEQTSFPVAEVEGLLADPGVFHAWSAPPWGGSGTACEPMAFHLYDPAGERYFELDYTE